METKINFHSLEHFNFIKQNVLDVINFTRGEDVAILRSKNWIYATLDDKQILDEDARNLACALSGIDCDVAYFGWICEFEKEKNFDIYKFQVDCESIVSIQRPESPLDNMASVVFGRYPLRFCIVRPDTFDKLLYVVGEESFVQRCCGAPGWKIFNNVTSR
ncbi:hypothetical protein [Paludibacterium paludis]|uniref:Uncharacterized protein n=2 Tax=Paludibacterium paludis TaxID=1225769 RepID=A0A918P618_9NEIS|nr:hypothetical protein [Paludibacterium paludis]GGY23509.1 hypothetical protein GCM10011289_29160 [Paludibacterium paludis]